MSGERARAEFDRIGAVEAFVTLDARNFRALAKSGDPRIDSP